MIIFLAIMAIIVMILWVVFGGIFLCRYKGQWCAATITPQICWTIGAPLEGGGNEANETEWNKMESVHVWYKPINGG